MQLNLLQKSQGTIFTKRVQHDNNGKVLTVNVVQSENRNDCSSSNFTRITTICFDEYGFRLLLADHRGSIFLFNFKENKYLFLVNCSQPTTALAFGLKDKPNNEFYVGLVDNSVRSFDMMYNQWLGTMRGHNCCIRAISVHHSGKLGLSYSVNSAIIWNLITWTKLRQLNVHADMGITQVFFQGDNIISCFRDDSIFMWNYETLECIMKLPPASKEPGQSIYRSIACSCDGRILVAAGKSRFIDIWNLDNGTLRQTIEMPKPIIGVRKIILLEPNKIESEGLETILAVLGEDRRLRLIQLSTCRLLTELSFDPYYHKQQSHCIDNYPVNFTASSRDCDPLVLSMTTARARADKLAVISSSIGNLHLYDLGAIWNEANKPELPIRKVWNKTPRSALSTTRKTTEVTLSNATNDCDSDSELYSSSRSNNTNNNNTISTITPETMLDRRKLRGILREYGQFPTKYRAFIWRGLMQLPSNVSALMSLVSKGIHPSWDLILDKYPLKSQKLTRCLQRVLSALAYWSPLFAECDFLPLLVFPFIKVFQNNLLLAFEMVASVLLNWCQDWFEYFPNPPINILCIVENVFAHHDPELYQHFVGLSVTTEIYAWPLMETVFSEVLTKEEWLALWDNLVCRHPGFLLSCVVAYSMCAKGPLLRVNNIEEIESFYRHQNCITTEQILHRALALDTITPKEIHPNQLQAKYQPLTKMQYPLFQKYPKFIVDHQIREREHIRQQEKEYLQQRAEAEEMQRRTEIHAAQEQSWYRQQEMLSRAEDRRKVMIAEEETRLREQKKRLNMLIERLQMRETQILNQSRSNARKFEMYKDTNTNELNSDSVDLTSRSAFEETEMAIQEAENKIRQLELKIGKQKEKEIRLKKNETIQLSNRGF